MNVKENVQKLLNGEITVSSLQDESVVDLRAIGRQFALRYRHAPLKDHKDTLRILSILIQIRKIVKQKLGATDGLMLRYEDELIRSTRLQQNS